MRGFFPLYLYHQQQQRSVIANLLSCSCQTFSPRRLTSRKTFQRRQTSFDKHTTRQLLIVVVPTRLRLLCMLSMSHAHRAPCTFTDHPCGAPCLARLSSRKVFQGQPQLDEQTTNTAVPTLLLSPLSHAHSNLVYIYILQLAAIGLPA